MPKIKLKRGLKANLPIFDEGEPGFTTDTEEFFVGSKDGNIQLVKQSDLTTTNTNVATNTANIATNTANISTNTTQIASKANQSDLNTTNANVSTNTTNIASNTSSLAENTPIKGTNQNITWNTDGTVQNIQHVDTNGNVLRQDVFTYSTNLITEVRTVGSNTLTFKYHLDTLQTEVI